jgi:hypothetical protein
MDSFPERVRLENRVSEYVRAGWIVESQTGVSAQLSKGDQKLRLSLDNEGQVVVDGPPLPAFYVDGRMRAWLVLLLMLIITFAVAWILGFFNV